MNSIRDAYGIILYKLKVHFTSPSLYKPTLYAHMPIHISTQFPTQPLQPLTHQCQQSIKSSCWPCLRRSDCASISTVLNHTTFQCAHTLIATCHIQNDSAMILLPVAKLIRTITFKKLDGTVGKVTI